MPAPLSTENQDLEQIMSEIVDQGGEITEAQEVRIQEIENQDSGVLDFAKTIKNTEASIETSKLWRQAQATREKAMEMTISALKTRILAVFVSRETPGNKVPAIKDPVITVSYVKPKPGSKGVLDVNTEHLQKTTYARGFTHEEAEASGIDIMLFKPVTVYVLDTKTVQARLEANVDVGPCRLIERKPYVRIVAPSLKVAKK